MRAPRSAKRSRWPRLRLLLVVVAAIVSFKLWGMASTGRTGDGDSAGDRESEGKPRAVGDRGGASDPGDGLGVASGEVVVAGTTTPVAKAQVLLTPVVTLAAAPGSSGVAPRPRTATSDVDGAWRFEGVVPGDYTLSATAPGARSTQHLKVQLFADEERGGLMLEVLRGGRRLHGAVTDVGGGAVPHARVSVTPLEGVHLGDFSLARWATLADEEGHYEIFVPTGALHVAFSHPDYVPVEANLSVPVAGIRHDVSLLPGSSISGVVVRASDREPVAGAQVYATRSGARRDHGVTRGLSSEFAGDSTRTDEEGRFRVSGLEAGVFEVRARAPGLAAAAPREIPLGFAEDVVDAEIRLMPAFRVSGRVVETGRDHNDPLPGVMVVGSFLNPPVTLQATGLSREDGTFEIEGVWPGVLFVSAAGEERVPSLSEISVTVEDEDVEGVVVEIEQGVYIEGRVTPAGETRLSLEFEETKENPLITRGKARANVYVQGRSRADGTFRLGPVPAENQVTVVAKADDGSTGKLPLLLKREDVFGVTIELETRGGIEGHVIDASGQPVVGVKVEVTAGADRPRLTTSLGTREGLSRQTTSDGFFSSEGLEAGDYVVSVLGNNGRSLVWHDAERSGSRIPKAVSVEEGERVQLELVVEPEDGVITGTVMDGRGEVVTDAFVSAVPLVPSSGIADLVGGFAGNSTRSSPARKPNEKLASAPVVTDLEGRFEISGLRHGIYDVVAKSSRRRSQGEAKSVRTGERADVTLEDLPSLRCEITEAGAPVSSVRGQLRGPTKRRIDADTAGGSLVIDRIKIGTYTLGLRSATGAGEAKVTVGDEEGDRCRVDLKSVGVVKGVIVDSVSRQPRAGVTPLLFERTPYADRATTALVTGNAPTSGPDGSFRLENVSPGGVTVLLIDNGGAQFGEWRGKARGVLEPGGTLDLGVVSFWEGAEVEKYARGTLGLNVVARTYERRPGQPKETESSPPDEPPGVVHQHLWVLRVTSGGPAGLAGIRRGDEVVSVDGVSVRSIGAFVAARMLMDRHVTRGATFALVLRREDKQLEVTLEAAAI